MGEGRERGREEGRGREGRRGRDGGKESVKGRREKKVLEQVKDTDRWRTGAARCGGRQGERLGPRGRCWARVGAFWLVEDRLMVKTLNR